MAKRKTIESEDLIKLLDEYRLENPGVKIKIPNFGMYIRNRGIEVQDHTIRRDKKFREYLDSVDKSTEEDVYHDLVTYRTIDIDAFLTRNNTKEKLKEAIIIRDRYYANVASRAAEAIREKNIAEEKVKKLEGRIAELEEQINCVQAKADNADIRKKNDVISKLRAILYSYIYPDAANAILKEQGILEIVNSVIPDEIMEEKMIHADTKIKDEKIKNSKYNSVNELLGGFDE